MPSHAEKCEALKQLHEGSETFIIPNPWDCGSARMMQGMGFKALATTSSGFAFTLGKGDGEVTLEEKLAHCTLLSSATDIPINADFENGFAGTAEEVQANIKRLAETGVAGGSIEDYDRDDKRLYDFNEAVERFQAAAEAVMSLDVAFQLTARAENLLRGVNDLDDTIKRLQAFEAAGAACLYAPGVRSLDDLKTVTGSLSTPFNMLAPMVPTASLADFAAAGANRISIGGALTFVAANPMLSAMKEMADDGTFGWLADMAPVGEIMELLKK